MKAVILAGGSGTRLWPLSVPEKPKQFQKIVSEKTLIEETLDRLDFLNKEDIYIAINESQMGLLKATLQHFPEENIIIEPALRDTLSCIGLATIKIEKKHPGSTMAVIYADHLIQNKQEFQDKIKIAAKLAEEDNTINIIEVEAKEPNTNYGYVQIGKIKKQIGEHQIYELTNFTEKPDTKTAEEFIKMGNYLWNTGIYVWKNTNILKYYQELKPDTYDKLTKISDAIGTPAEQETIAKIYPELEKISIDYGIMEKIDRKNVSIIKADLGWSDIGNWEAIWERLQKSSKGNIARGDTKLIDCENCLIYGDNSRKVAAIGLKNIVVIDTPNGLLICEKDQSKRVKEI